VERLQHSRAFLNAARFVVSVSEGFFLPGFQNLSRFMDHPYLLIVHPDKSARALLRGMLDGMNYRIAEASGYRVGVGMLGRDPDALILAGANAGDPEALEFLASVQRQRPQVPLILLLSGEAPDLANQALRFGAASVLKFPLPTTQVRAAVLHALNQSITPSQRIGGAVPCRPTRPDPRPVESAMVGEDLALRQALGLARAVAPTGNPVLIVGAPGTGKSLLARIVHELSPRRNGPFVEVCCKGRPEAALEDDLFGGWLGECDAARSGKLALAHGGTLVLDEVNSLSPALQLKLHMVLHDGHIETLSTARVVQVDVRLILTGGSQAVTETMLGRFWQHLYAHNSTATLRLPPLQDRGTDVIRLAEHFAARAAGQRTRGAIGFAPESLAALARYPWPGNVAELRTVVGKAVSHSQGTPIEPVHLGLSCGEGLTTDVAGRDRRGHAGAARRRVQPLRDALAEPEKWLILRALQVCDWNRQETADTLVINRATLEKKMKKYGLCAGSSRVLQECGDDGIEG
jgi:DNA-binding NtrC family response regulator